MNVAALDRLLGPPGEAGIAALDVAEGGHVLDLGCGAGASTARLADALGTGGRVTAVDISPDLVAAASARLADRDGVSVVEADAGRHDFGAQVFDGLFSRFGAMFFDDPPAAYRRLHGAMKPGAPLVIVCWRDPARNPWASVPMSFAAEGFALPGPTPGPGPFAWADPGVFRPLLTDAGFRDVHEDPFDFRAEIGAGDDPDPVRRAIQFMMRIGPLASRLRDAPQDVRAEAEAFLQSRLARHVSEGAVRLLGSVWIVTARA